MASLLAVQPVSSRSLTGLYVHIPFCDAKCHYCDFAVYIGQKKSIDRYLAALNLEFQPYFNTALRTIYIGGGTPSVLSAAQFESLSKSIRLNFFLEAVSEFTVEVNPESVTPELLAAMRIAGVNRLSIGLQSTEPQMLSYLGREHTYDGFLKAYEMARKVGFSNISFDLMLGLPGQTLEGWNRTLKKIVDLDPEHISAYALKIEAGTRFMKNDIAVDDDIQAEMYLEAARVLASAGYRHYEISNFSKPGFESRHNSSYWLNEPTIGIGVSAASFFGGRRYTNMRALVGYMDRLESGKLPDRETIELSADQQNREDVMLGLRLAEGVDRDRIDNLNVHLFQEFLSRGLAEISGDRYRLTTEGWLLSNQLFERLV